MSSTNNNSNDFNVMTANQATNDHKFDVFIPRMFSNISERRIEKVFHDLDIGLVHHTDLVKRTNDKGQTYNMAFVHFQELYDTESARSFRADVENTEKQAKIVYEDPWFWIVLPFESKEQPPMIQEQSQSPMIQSQPQELSSYSQATPWYPPQVFHPYPIGYGTMMMTPQGPMWYPMESTGNTSYPPKPYNKKHRKARKGPKQRINPVNNTQENREDGEL